MQLVWFLAPTVALCLQQHDVIASQIPSVKTRVLIGADNVDRWTEQAIWNNALKDIRVVCSTHAVLSDALNHGFVRMSQLALLVFDEGNYWTQSHLRLAGALIHTRVASSSLYTGPPGEQNHAVPLPPDAF